MLNTYLKYFALILALGFIVSCSDDDNSNNPTPVNEAQVLAEYIESSSNYMATSMPAMITAEEVRTLNLTNKIHVIDVRSAAVYAEGHIPGAVNVQIADILDHVKTLDMSKYDKIAIACFTGQSASFATSILRLLGYDKVFTLKFGMASWGEANAASWSNAVGSARSSQFVTEETAKAAMGELPTINTGKSNGMEILEARAKELLAAGYGSVSVTADAVFGNLNGYYIVNYWPMAHYLDPGHIPGAVQYTPKEDLKLANFLKTLPTDKPIAIYCYTGQTSAHLSAYLKILGYDAKTIGFGTSGMALNLVQGKTGFTYWKDEYCMKYDVVK